MNPQRRREKKESKERDARATPAREKNKKKVVVSSKNLFRVSSKEKWKRLKTTPPLHSPASDISSISRTHARTHHHHYHHEQKLRGNAGGDAEMRGAVEMLSFSFSFSFSFSTRKLQLGGRRRE
jgi:hypothetical protein